VVVPQRAIHHQPMNVEAGNLQPIEARNMEEVNGEEEEEEAGRVIDGRAQAQSLQKETGGEKDRRRLEEVVVRTKDPGNKEEERNVEDVREEEIDGRKYFVFCHYTHHST